VRSIIGATDIFGQFIEFLMLTFSEEIQSRVILLCIRSLLIAARYSTKIPGVAPCFDSRLATPTRLNFLSLHEMHTKMQRSTERRVNRSTPVALDGV
jgi:hypothetical protein